MLDPISGVLTTDTSLSECGMWDFRGSGLAWPVWGKDPPWTEMLEAQACPLLWGTEAPQ